MRSSSTRLRCALVGNPQAGDGTAMQQAGKAISDHDGLALLGEPIDLLAADGAADALETARRAEPDIIAVAGGDGTLRAVARIMVSTGNPVPLAPLPGGTMNLLPRLIYGDRSVEQVIDCLADGRRVALPGGWAGNEPFLIAAIFGYPNLAAKAREAFRETGWTALGEVAEAAADVFVRSGEEAFAASIDGAPAERAAAFVISLYPLDILHGDLDAARQRQTHERFHLARVASATPLSRLRLAGAAIAGTWLDDALVDTMIGSRLELRGTGARSALLDGEPVALDDRVDIRFEDRMLQVIAPHG